MPRLLIYTIHRRRNLLSVILTQGQKADQGLLIERTFTQGFKLKLRQISKKN